MKLRDLLPVSLAAFVLTSMTAAILWLITSRLAIKRILGLFEVNRRAVFDFLIHQRAVDCFCRQRTTTLYGCLELARRTRAGVTLLLAFVMILVGATNEPTIAFVLAGWYWIGARFTFGQNVLLNRGRSTWTRLEILA